MVKLSVKFSQIGQVKEFVNALFPYDVAFDLVHNRYVVDAKSIMGIFSMDLSTPLQLIVYSDDTELVENVKKDLQNIGVLDVA